MATIPPALHTLRLTWGLGLISAVSLLTFSFSHTCGLRVTPSGQPRPLEKFLNYSPRYILVINTNLFIKETVWRILV